MAIEELLAVVPPPARPREAGDRAAWTQIEQWIGTRLPADFQDFVFHYGTGVFNDPGRLCIFPRNPLSASFRARFQEDCEWLQDMKELASAEDFSFAVHPTSPGLILWADDDNGCMFFWLTEGDPDSWPTLVTPPRGYYWERFDMPMTSFLARAFSRRLVCVPWQQQEFFSGPRPVKFAQEQGEIEYQ